MNILLHMQFMTPPDIYCRGSKSNKSEWHKHEGTAKNVFFEWSDHTQTIPSTDPKVGNAGLVLQLILGLLFIENEDFHFAGHEVN